MAAQFQMDPQVTLSGLTGAGMTAQHAVASSMPALQVGTYDAPYMTTLGAIVGVLTADLEGSVDFGLANSAASVTTVESTESSNVSVLTT